MRLLVFAAFVVFISILSQTACYYDNEEDLYGTVVCDTVAISFASDIKPIIDANCVRCHAPGGEQESSPLLTYDDLKKYTSDGDLTDRTSGTVGLMPPDGKMNECNVTMIKAWVDAGAPNN